MGKGDPSEPEKTAIPHWKFADERIVNTSEIKEGMNDQMEEKERM